LKDIEHTELKEDNLLLFIYSRGKILLIVAVVAILVSLMVSFFIKDKYKSIVILYPTTTSSISKALISENNGGREDVLKFGEVEESEQMIQILKSDEIRKRVIKKYHLLKHYNISLKDKYKNTKLFNKYEDNISFKLTKYMAVKIEVLDYNADTAALIANSISDLLDTVKNKMRGVIANQAFKIVAQQYTDQKNYVEGLEDSLKILRKLGVIDYESQAERLTEQMAIAILQGKKRAAKELQQKLAILVKYGGAYVSIRDQLEYEKKQLTFIRSKYEEAKVDAKSQLQHKFIVDNAFPAERSSYPIRWLIVLVSTFATLLLTLVVLLLNKKIRNKNS